MTFTRLVCKSCNSIDIFKTKAVLVEKPVYECRQCRKHFTEDGLVNLTLYGQAPAKKYRIRLSHPDRIEEVEGEPLVIEGYEQLQFFVRQGPLGMCATEVNTGMMVGDWGENVQEVAQTVRQKVYEAGLEKFLASVAKHKLPEVVA